MADDPHNIHDPKSPQFNPRAGAPGDPGHALPQPVESDPAHQLPWPEESDPARLSEAFAQGTGREQLDLGRSFERRNDNSGREERGELGREFADPHYAEEQRLARSFADPNSLDDTRLGNAFEETNSTRKKQKPPIAERVHKPRNWRPVFFIVGALLLLALLGLLIGVIPRHNRDKKIDQQASERRNAKPVVEVQKATQVTSQQGLVLPGTTIPLTEAYIYARANGYLKKRYADIGDHVIKGQLLAVVDAPDLDAQVAQAREQLRQAEQQLEQQRSQLALATVTVNRYRVLVAKGVFSRQDGDTQETNYASYLANVAAAQRNVDAYRANLDRNIALQSYEQVRSPFTGVVTQRNVDVGALIASSGTTGGPISGPAPQGQTSATGGSQQAAQANTAGVSGNANTSATPAQSPGQGGPLFGIAQQQRLRILVSVPEGYVNAVEAGGHAQVSFQEYPGQPFYGDITRTADAVDPNTRTMLTEVQLDNRDGRLKSGMYAVVTFPPSQGLGGPIMVDGDAVVIRHDQTTVAKVINGKVHFVPVVVGRDFGSGVEIISGVQPGDLVVTDVTDDVVENASVQAHQATSPDQQPAQPPSQNVPPGGTSRYGNQGITDQNMQGKQAQQNGKGEQHGKSSGGDSSKQQSSSSSKP
ncbi:MAG TPA: efflux RND transporter periplasmic adaptor subunit [Acidobacteriaceae bacterium]|nr:efflux RND transporter periplasmic adaptor subunit [Acidobacteriaceae bacterium]